MTTYLEQSANTFVEMQQQLQKQARNMFTGFPFTPFGTSPGTPGPDDTKK
jgi:polyhydroxyalkanoate synthesis regulator protein